VDRARSRPLLAIVTALVVAEATVLLMRPRQGIVEPAPVSATTYFTPAQLERARDYRRPQLALYAGSLLLQGGFLVLVIRRPPRRLRDAGRSLRAAAVTGAGLAAGLTLVALPLSAIARQRTLDVGLATQGWADWAGDVAKAVGIESLLAAGGALLAVGMIRRFGPRWWLPGSAVVVAVGAVFLFAAPVVVDPVFNRFTPLPPGPVRSDVLDLARRANVKVGEVYVMDASRRTTAANAYVTGLGATKRVVLYDTLLERFTREETRLVVAHELGHVHHRDLLRGLLFLALVAPAAMLAVATLTSRLARGATGAQALPALVLSFALVGGAVGVLGNGLSRRVEARADAFSLDLTGATDAFVEFERRITLRNVSDPDPPGWIKFLLGTHPSTVERIGAARALEAARRP
jgi:STE24 endopeptidase